MKNTLLTQPTKKFPPEDNILTEHEIDKPSDKNREKTSKEKTTKKTTIQKICSPSQTRKKSKLEERNLQKKMMSDNMKK